MWEKFLMWIELKLSAKNWDAKVYENFKQNWIVFFLFLIAEFINRFETETEWRVL